MNEQEPERTQPSGWAINGCLFTVLVWLFAAFMMLGSFAGDCLREQDHACPSDHERVMSLVWVALGAMLINVLGLFLLGWLHARRNMRR
jgi:hypothetical protein